MMYTVDFEKYDRIFTFGCSYTSYRWDTWANLLASQFPEKEFYNYGCPGSGNLQIVNTLLQADTCHTFSSSDLILVCWTFADREDRIYISHKGYPTWTKGGCVYTEEHFNDSFFSEYTSDIHYYFQTMHLMKLTESFFKSKNLLYVPFSTARYSVPNMPMFQDTVNDFANSVNRLPNIHGSVWDSCCKRKQERNKLLSRDFNDTHPSPAEYAKFIRATFNYPWGNLFSEKVKQSELRYVDSAKSGSVCNIQTYKSLPLSNGVIR